MLTDLDMQLLTHHALGELPAARLPEIERLLAEEPEARTWLAEVRAAAAALGAALAEEMSAQSGLDPGRRAAIDRAVRLPLRFRRWLVPAALLAAGLAMALLLPGLGLVRRHATAPAPIAESTPTAVPPPASNLAPPAPVRQQPVPELGEMVAAAASPAPPTQPVVELEPEAAPVDMEVAAVDAVRASPVGREEAVADADLGGAGRFESVGAGSWGADRRGDGGMFGAPAATPRPTPSEGLFGWRAAAPPQPPVAGMPVQAGGETYARIQAAPPADPQARPLSTFGLDVDTAAYANVRRFIEQGRLPPLDAVRIEELLNAFVYDDPPPPAGSGRPFAVRAELGVCPWAPGHRLARIAVSAMTLPAGARPPCNLVFLVDVSGSMGEPGKLGLVRTALTMLAGELRDEDRVAIVTYSDEARLVLPSTPGSQRQRIVRAVGNLTASGSTNGAAGIQLAYRTAEADPVVGVNRVILCTDGDFNVGAQSPAALRELIAEKRRGGVTLSALGFGMGNLKDANLQALADAGNGSHAYIDSAEEARTALVAQLDRMVLVAKDAKVQVEFNPARVASWRLLGYEKRRLAARDFADDRVDSGDIGAGAHVTALYELEVLPGPGAVPGGLRYQPEPAAGPTDAELMFVQLRWKQPDQERSELLRFPVTDAADRGPGGSDLRFAAAVAAFGLALRDDPDRGAATLPLAAALARDALGEDRDGSRRAFVRLAGRAAELAPGR